jgi:hypothetical protein
MDPSRVQSSSGSSWGSPDAAASPATATKIVAGSRPVVPGGFDTLTQVPSELITTGGYLESAGLNTSERELRLGLLKLPPRALLKNSVSWSAKLPSALGVKTAGTRDLERLTGFEAAGAEAAGDLSTVSSPAARAAGNVSALSRVLPRLGLRPFKFCRCRRRMSGWWWKSSSSSFTPCQAKHPGKPLLRWTEPTTQT